MRAREEMDVSHGIMGNPGSQGVSIIFHYGYLGFGVKDYTSQRGCKMY